MNLLHITKAEDLVTSYSETRAGFISIALEKNRRATPYVEEARALQYRIKTISSPYNLLEVPDIKNGLIAAAGLSDKAASHLGEEGCTVAMKEFIEKILAPSGDAFKEELVFRFLLTKGDSLGGKMRNIVGALAQRKLCLAIISSLKLSNIPFYALNDTASQWISSKEIGYDTEVENSKGISWKTLKDKDRTLFFNITVPIVGNNIDIVLLDGAYTENIKTAIGQCENYIALGELKGGIDPAGADEHWKTAKTALDRIKNAFKNNDFSPNIFFVGAAIESKMAGEIFNDLKSKYINNAANLTKPEHITALSDWLVKL
ncbi:MAG: type II restriction endonuclease [Spirochaetes bacterium]|nr:type II restriction endonuclease [Spirochaetota bacterium]